MADAAGARADRATGDAGPAGLFTGVGVALVTLFRADGALDAPATAEHASRLVEEGVQGIVVAGSTGEAATLDVEERSTLLAAVLEAVDDRVPVIAGTGAASARQATELSRRAADGGAAALLVLSPPGASDPRPYYDQVTAAVDVPVLAYHYPYASRPGIPVDVLSELPAVGVKDSAGDAARLAIEVDEVPWVYTGSPALLLHGAAIGCRGAILALANLDPAGCIRSWNGDGRCQRELVNGHRPGGLAGIAGLKRTMHALYGTSPITRVG